VSIFHNLWTGSSMGITRRPLIDWTGWVGIGRRLDEQEKP
jgi:hypothetical protein